MPPVNYFITRYNCIGVLKFNKLTLSFLWEGVVFVVVLGIVLYKQTTKNFRFLKRNYP